MSQISDISDSDDNGDISDSDDNGDISDSSERSNDTIFSKNNKYVKKPFIEAGKSILNTTSASNSVNPTIPAPPSLDKGYENDARTDARFAGQQAREQRFSDVLDSHLKAKLLRQQKAG